MTQAFTRGEPNLVNDPIDISSDRSLSLPETLSLLSTPSISQTSTTSFPPNFPTILDNRYKEHLTNNIPLRLDWNTFVAPPPLFDQYLDSNRLHNWALNRLQYRHDIHEDIQEHNIQILTQDNLTLKFEKTVKLNNLVHHALHLAIPNITAQSFPPPFITTEIIYKYDRYTKRHLVTSYSIIHIQDYPTYVFFNNPSLSNPSPFNFFRTNKS